MNQSVSELKSFQVGGNLIVDKMDSLLGFAKIVKKMKLKVKGVPLEGILKSLVAFRLNKPASVVQTVEELRGYSFVENDFGITLEMLSEKTFYRGLETLGENAPEVYSNIIGAADKKFGLDLGKIMIDWTSVLYNGAVGILAKHGHSKERRNDRPQVKVGIAVTEKDCIPFFFSVDEGNTPDVVQFQTDIEGVQKHLPKDALYVYDKGGSCKDIEDDIIESKRHYLTAVRSSEKLNDRYRNLSKKSMCLVHTYSDKKKVYGTMEKKGDEYFLHYFDERRAGYILKTRQRKLLKATTARENDLELIQRRGIQAAKKRFTKQMCKTINCGESIISAQVTIQNRLYKMTDEQLSEDFMAGRELDGYFSLKSSKKLTPKTALKLYRRKDCVEKAISALKSVHSIRPFRVRNDNEIKGAVLICMLAMLFTSILQMLHDLKDHTQKTVVGWIRNLTLVVKFGADNAILSKDYANFTPFLKQLLSTTS